MKDRTSDHEVVRALVRRILERSDAYRQLAPDQQRRIAVSTVHVAQAAAADPLVAEADFPSFVADLIQGTFEAIVDASIQQMEAYADLIEDVASDLDEFTKAIDDKDAYDYLHRRGLHPDSKRWSRHGATLLLPAARAQAAKERQRLLATMVLIGIQRTLDPDRDQDD